MVFKTIVLAAVVSSTFAGTAFAALPESGEGPLFQHEPVTVSTVNRADVIRQAIASPPLVNAGPEFPDRMGAQASSMYTRTEVREQTRYAIAHGYRPASGEMS